MRAGKVSCFQRLLSLRSLDALAPSWSKSSRVILTGHRWMTEAKAHLPARSCGSQ